MESPVNSDIEVNDKKKVNGVGNISYTTVAQ